MSLADYRCRSRRLVEYACGALAPADAAPLERHLAGCERCRGWLSTYRLLEESVPGMEPAARHPDAEQLAQLALDGGSLDAAARDRIGRHLTLCAPCRRDSERCVAAVDEARRGDRGLEPRPAAATGATRAAPVYRWRWALAAGLAALAIGAGAFREWRATALPDRVVVADRSILESTVVESAGSIAVAASHVDRGGNLTLRAAAVELGEGFSVGQDGALAIVATPRAKRF